MMWPCFSNLLSNCGNKPKGPAQPGFLHDRNFIQVIWPCGGRVLVFVTGGPLTRRCWSMRCLSPIARQVLPIAIMVMIVAPMIVIVAVVAITVIAAVVAIWVAAVAIISMAICTPMMSAMDASNTPGC